MIIYLYDGSFDGLFTAIFDSYKNKETPSEITSELLYYPFNSKIVNVTTDVEKAKRVKNKVYSILKSNGKTAINYVFRSNDENKSTIIYKFVKKIIDENTDLTENFADQDAYALYKIYEKVRYERHRFLGFVRFLKTDYGIYYAKIMPDNNIVDLILPHFISRFKNMAFVIHDEKRNIYACYNNGKTAILTLQNGEDLFKNVNDEFAKLFKKYYDTVNIKQRKNLKTMRNFMPTRYHRNMPEKNELL